MKSQIYFKIKNIYVCNSGKENDVLFAAILNLFHENFGNVILMLKITIFSFYIDELQLYFTDFITRQNCCDPFYKSTHGYPPYQRFFKTAQKTKGDFGSCLIDKSLLDPLKPSIHAGL